MFEYSGYIIAYNSIQYNKQQQKKDGNKIKTNQKSKQSKLSFGIGTQKKEERGRGGKLIQNNQRRNTPI